MTTQTLPDGADRVTVVVLTHQRRHEVLRTVTKLRALAASPRIVVIDNASTDGTAAALRDGGVDVVRLSRNVGAAARNIGLRAATTPYVAFCDDDTWWSDTGLRAAAVFLDANPAVAIVSGHVLVGDNQRIDPTCAVMAATPLAGGTTNTGFPVLGFLAGAALVRRDALLQAGGISVALLHRW